MKPRAVIDLHCDTLTACNAPGRCRDTLDDPCANLALSSLPRDVRWGQFYAIFVPDELNPEESAAYYATHQKSFQRQMEYFSSRVAPCRTAADMETAWAHGKAAALLTVENGSALAGDLDRVEVLARDGVRAITLTWNGVNEIGSGNVSDLGLTDFGRAVISAIEDHGILADVSHLNDNSFYDFLKVARKPFVATHSNARAVCGHKRNLTDDQIREMVRRRCLIGLNFSTYFLRDGGQATPDDLFRHVAHFLELGAENCLALGSDFDGTQLPPWLHNSDQEASLFGFLVDRGLSSALAEQIMYRNALAFFHKNLA